MLLMAKQPKIPPSYRPAELLNAFLDLMAFQKHMWDVARDVFLANPRQPRMRLTVQVTRADLMQLTAVNLFDYLEYATVLTVLMGVASFLDKVHMGTDQSKANLVLRRVVNDLAPPVGTPERLKIEADLARAEQLATPIFLTRDKLGAHHDLATNIGVMKHYRHGDAYPLRNATGAELEEIMECFTRITDAIVATAAPGRVWYAREIEVDRFFDTLLRGLTIPVAAGPTETAAS
jgi:hypothetical protein